MLRFFLHLVRNTEVVRDLEGIEYSNLDAAIVDATQAREEYLRDYALDTGTDRSQCHFEITNACGVLVAVVPPGNF